MLVAYKSCNIAINNNILISCQSYKDSKQNCKMTKKEQERQYIEWRRSKILELKAQGYTTERELASKLNVSDSTIHSDFVFLKEQARENLNTHIQDRLPSEYERCITGMNQVLKMSWDIANGSIPTAQNLINKKHRKA